MLKLHTVATLMVVISPSACSDRVESQTPPAPRQQNPQPDSGPAIPPPAAPKQADASTPTAHEQPLIEEIKPYVLMLGADHATLCWMTRHSCIGQVRLHDYDTETVHTETAPAGHMHRVAIRGLTPGTTYRYEIGRNHQGTFTTADTLPEFEVAVFGHPGGTDRPLEYPTEMLQGRLMAISPDFALCTGDITLNATMRGMRDTFLRRFDTFLASRPIYVSPSNHEGRFNGNDYEVFRALFPYDYGLASGGSYWFDYKQARFFALSYKLRTPELFREHVSWLADAIDHSPQEFNIVFLGGQDESYYDKDMLFETLASRPVELVLGGDGGGTFQQQPHGVDFFFSGDGDTGAYPFYYLRFHAHHFDVQLHYSDASRRSQSFRSFYSKKQRTVLRQLAPCRTESPAHQLNFVKIGEPSTAIDGLHLTIDWPHDEDVELQMVMKPSHTGASKEQCHLVKAKSRTEVLIDIPEWSPTDHAGKTYELAELLVQLAPHRPYYKKYDLQAAVSDVYLFAR